jgi:hypothetical protein
MAGFQVTLHGRFWLTPEVASARQQLKVGLILILVSSGAFREREPKLEEILKHPRLVVLGEPGACKSLVARAAVQEILTNRERVPVFTELKQYRGDLQSLLERSAPHDILSLAVPAGLDHVKRTYILDGVDEIPQEYLAASAKRYAHRLGCDRFRRRKI